MDIFTISRLAKLEKMDSILTLKYFLFITSLSVRWNHWNFFFLLWNWSTIFIINKIWTLFVIDTVYDRHLINTLKIDTMCAQQGLGSNWDYYYARSFISSSLLPNAHLVTIANCVKFSPKLISPLCFFILNYMMNIIYL